MSPPFRAFDYSLIVVFSVIISTCVLYLIPANDFVAKEDIRFRQTNSCTDWILEVSFVLPCFAHATNEYCKVTVNSTVLFVPCESAPPICFWAFNFNHQPFWC